MKIPVIDPIRTGQNIKRLKEERGYSCHEIRRACGMGHIQGVYNWLYGHKIPSTDNLVILAHFFKVKIEDILAIDYVEVSNEDRWT